jgi:hypothetical protein
MRLWSFEANDVINMDTLFGLSVKFAKAAVSKNYE